MDSEERVFLTPEQAEAMLPDGDIIHTFRSGVGILLGADWKRKDILAAIRDPNAKPELAGRMATHMGHGLLLSVDGWLFVETRPAKED